VTSAITLVIGFAAGRFSASAKTVERDRIVTVDRDTTLTFRAYVGRSERRVETETKWRTVTKWEPGGAVTQTTEAVREEKQEEKQEVAQSETQVREVVKYRDVEKIREVEAKKPDWLISGRAGILLDERRPVYGASVDRRIVGPVFVGLWGQAAGASLGGAAAGGQVSLIF